MHILFCVNNAKFRTKCFVKTEHFVLPFIVGQIAQWNWTKKPYIPEGTKPFNDMIKEISTFLPHSACVSSEGLTPLKDETDPHFDAASQITLGKRYAKEVKKLIKK